MVPEDLTKLVNAVQEAKFDAESAADFKTLTGQALVEAKQADDDAYKVMKEKANLLNDVKLKLDKFVSEYFRVGGQPPPVRKPPADGVQVAGDASPAPAPRR